MKKLILGITVPQSKIFLYGQISYLSRKGYHVYLMTAYDDAIENFCNKEGCTYLRVNTVRDVSFLKDIAALLRILLYFIKIRPDIVNVGTPKMGLLGIVAAKLTLVRNRIFTCHGLISEKKLGLYGDTFLKLIDRLPGVLATKIICVSPSIKEVREKLFKETKCIVINKGSCNGFDLSRFSQNNVSDNEKQNLKHKLSITDSFIFGFVGRLVDEKGIRELYDAFSCLYNENGKIRLLVIGGVELASFKDKSLLDKMKNHPGILLVGIQYNIPLYLSIMNVFVLPTWREGFGNVLVEAAAMGVPVISTLVTGCKDAVSDGYNGILVPARNVEELRQKMLLLYNNNELRNKLGTNGLDWAKNFRNEVIWQGLEQVYESL